MAEFNPETATMDELRKAAEAEALKQSTKTSDEEIVVDTADVIDPPEPKTFFTERTIDLGDGAGVQVFKGKGATREEAIEDMADKLVVAQKHASIKIRELSKAKPVEKVVNKDDDALLAAELLATPSAALDKVLREKYGDPDEIKQAVADAKAAKAARKHASVADQFVKAHPDFLDNERNGKLLNKWLTLHNDFSLDGFEKAYTDLSESGLLTVKDAEAGDEQKKAEAEAKRIADAAEAASSQRTKRSSGLSTQRRTPTPVAEAPSEEDMYALPLEELRKRANQQLAPH